MSDWQRIQSIFLAAADLPVEERDHAVGVLCEGDPELFDEVHSLLAADNDSSVTIDSAIQGVAATILDTPILIGERLGAYRVVREIGRGGMGSVYLALRDDEEYVKEVALKVVKRGMNTEEALRRFRDERQILANLDHPYIARLFDGGTTADGVPFFAMEYVEGRPVDVFCRENALSVKARCYLFLHILEAVAYAHRNLVVHGDLKPANIFVTPDATPKLLDFGVAKLVGRDPEEDPDNPSPRASRAFTPGYASPEQVRGLAVTTSSDIYSLGAVLYELLSGQRVQPVDFDTPTRIERAVCDVEVGREQLAKLNLPSDLDHVVLMALCKEPEHRYQSAAQFADDIRRSLENRPVIARENTLGYLARKFVARNLFEVAMGTLVALALIAGLVFSLAQTRRAEAARAVADSQRQIAVRERAEAEAARASEATQRSLADQQRALALAERDEANAQKAIADQRLDDIFQLADRTLFDVHEAIAPLPGSLPARRKIVETTLQYLQSMEKNVGANQDLREALTAAYYKVALIQGDPHGASLQDAASAEKSLLKAQEILLPAYRLKPNDPNLMLRWIEVRSGLADLMYRSDRANQAVQIYIDLIPVAHRVSLTPGSAITVQAQEEAVENALVYELNSINPELALQHATHGAAVGRVLLARHPGDKTLTQSLGAITAAAAGSYRNLGDLEKAAEYYRQSIDLRERLYNDDPNNQDVRRSLIITYGNYAALLDIPWTPNLGRPEQARIYAAKSVAVARDELAADTKNATARLDLAMSLGRLGMVDPAPGEASASVAALHEARSLIEPLAAANPKSTSLATNLALVMEFEAIRLDEASHTAEAVETYRKALALLDPFAESPQSSAMPEYVSIEQDLALLTASTGDPQAATRLAQNALDSVEKMTVAPSLSELHVASTARAWSTLALTQAKAGSNTLARQSAEKAMQLWNSVRTPGLLTVSRKPMADTRALLGSLAGDTAR
ncbi:MAG TPA: serine/threonine-protein kinase [Acidobacteriaceae bacterium]